MNDQKFQEMIVKASAKASDTELADLLGLGRPTIRRWREGVSCPHPVVHPSIERILKKHLDVGQSD